MFSASVARAQGDKPELITDRPDQTESSSVVPRGLWQFELGWVFGEGTSGAEDLKVNQVPSSLLRVGLLDRLELRFGWNGMQVQSLGNTRSRGAGDAQIGAKVALWNQNGVLPKTALLLGTSIPSGSRQFSTQRTDPGIRLLMSSDLTETFSLGWNLGTVWETTEEAADKDTFPRGVYTVALGISALEKTGFFVEFFGDTALNGRSRAVNNLDGGLTHLIRPNVQLDFAVGKGLSSESLDWFLTAGVSFRLPY